LIITSFSGLKENKGNPRKSADIVKYAFGLIIINIIPSRHLGTLWLEICNFVPANPMRMAKYVK
jgi:hypothetical protein